MAETRFVWSMQLLFWLWILFLVPAFPILIQARPNVQGNQGLDGLQQRSSLSRRSTTTSEILRQHLQQALSNCNSREPPPTQKMFVNDDNAVCNDGSRAGYFIRKSHGSKRWIVFLEGGWYCYDEQSCENRWNRLRAFMTSSTWPKTRQVSGLLSPDPEENLFWWNANHVYVPYCSSDAWSGEAPAGNGSRFAFMGSVIVREVLRDLLPQGLLNASKLMLTGSSAGGIGVLLNLDRVADFMRAQGSSVEVRGVADSGWFLDNDPYAPADCYDPQRCEPLTAVRKGYHLWKGQVPQACRAQYPGQPWKCYFGHHLHRTLRTPLFVFQWLFDEAQMTVDNVGPPMSKEQWDYIHDVGDDLRRTFANVTAVFAPSCISHTVLTKRDWHSIRIGDVSLPQALRCWELQPYWPISNHVTANPSSADSEEENLTTTHALRHSHKRYNPANTESNPIVLLADDPELPGNSQLAAKTAKNLVKSGQHRPLGDSLFVNTTQIKGNKNSGRNSTKRKEERRKQRRKQRRKGEADNGAEREKPKEKEKNKGKGKSKRPKSQKDNNHSSQRRNNKERKRKKEISSGAEKTVRGESRPRSRRDTAAAADWRPPATPDACQHRLIDPCSWPHCNRDCPKLHNPFTGEEMDFIQLLKSFGLDMGSVANALGIDMHTLNNMDHNVLLRLLTQQTT